MSRRSPGRRTPCPSAPGRCWRRQRRAPRPCYSCVRRREERRRRRRPRSRTGRGQPASGRYSSVRGEIAVAGRGRGVSGASEVTTRLPAHQLPRGSGNNNKLAGTYKLAGPRRRLAATRHRKGRDTGGSRLRQPHLGGCRPRQAQQLVKQRRHCVRCAAVTGDKRRQEGWRRRPRGIGGCWRSVCASDDAGQLDFLQRGGALTPAAALLPFPLRICRLSPAPTLLLLLQGAPRPPRDRPGAGVPTT